MPCGVEDAGSKTFFGGTEGAEGSGNTGADDFSRHEAPFQSGPFETRLRGRVSQPFDWCGCSDNIAVADQDPAHRFDHEASLPRHARQLGETTSAL